MATVYSGNNRTSYDFCLVVTDVLVSLSPLDVKTTLTAMDIEEMPRMDALHESGIRMEYLIRPSVKQASKQKAMHCKS